MSEDQEVFVSRRGRKTKLDDIDLGSVNIDEQQPLKETEKTAPVKAAKPMKKPSREPRQPVFTMPKVTRPEVGRRTWIMTLIVLSVILFAPILLLEGIALQYRSGADALRNDVKAIAKNTALPEQKKVALSDDAIAKTLNALNASRDNSCKGGFLDNLAELYPRSNDALRQCATLNGQVSALINSLSVLKNMQSYSKSTEAALRPALAASDSPYAVIPDQLTSWQTAEGKLKAINPPSQLASFHTSLKQVVSDIAAQWSALNNANNGQDTASFKDAEGKLSSFYESLRELSPTLTEAQQKAQTDVSSAAARI